MEQKRFRTDAGTRVLPITDEVAEMFRAIIEDRPKYKVEKVVGGYTGFLFLDKKECHLWPCTGNTDLKVW